MPLANMAFLDPSCLIFNGAFVLAMWAYHEGMVTDPGRIPDGWRGEPDGLPAFAQETGGLCFQPQERKKTSGGYRYCNKENIFKPDRAHYCHALSRNVLRMDHYCPWFGNCVGYFNHKYFFLFLFYSVISSGVAQYHFIQALSHGGLSSMQTIMIYQGVGLSALINVFLTPFCGFHCWLISKNMTTLEFCEQWSKATSWTSRYDQGLLRNIQSVFGNRWYLWPLPVAAPTVGGVFFEANGVISLADADSARTDASSSSEQRKQERSCCRYCGKGSSSGSSSGRMCASFAGCTCVFNELFQDACLWGSRMLGWS